LRLATFVHLLLEAQVGKRFTHGLDFVGENIREVTPVLIVVMPDIELYLDMLAIDVNPSVFGSVEESPVEFGMSFVLDAFFPESEFFILLCACERADAFLTFFDNGCVAFKLEINTGK
jgi:hypothetical protein